MAYLLLQLTLPGSRQREVLEALRLVMRPARLDRDCVAARVMRDVDAPEAVACIEIWASEEALARRVASAEFSRLLAVMEALQSPPSLEFVVSGVQGLEYVEAVRLRDGAVPPQETRRESA